MSYVVKDGDKFYQMNPPDIQTGDEILIGKNWFDYREICDEPEKCGLHKQRKRRRLIDPNLNAKPGETWKIVGLEDSMPNDYELFNKNDNEWHGYFSNYQGKLTVKEWLLDAENILAIRVRVEQDEMGKVDKQDESMLTEKEMAALNKSVKPFNKKLVPVESNTGQEICECGHRNDSHSANRCFGTWECLCQQFKPATRKEGDEGHCDNAMIHPRIYTHCPACGNDTLTINKGHLLCTWHECPEPTLIDKGQRVPPKPVSVKERLPMIELYKFVRARGLVEDKIACDNGIGTHQCDYHAGAANKCVEIWEWIEINGGLTKEQIMNARAIPPTPTTSDEGFEEWWFRHTKVNVDIMDDEKALALAAWHAAKKKEGV
jgi:hypothetical protein